VSSSRSVTPLPLPPRPLYLFDMRRWKLTIFHNVYPACEPLGSRTFPILSWSKHHVDPFRAKRNPAATRGQPHTHTRSPGESGEPALERERGNLRSLAFCMIKRMRTLLQLRHFRGQPLCTPPEDLCFQAPRHSTGANARSRPHSALQIPRL
jgi:hypothetical protein